jgi:hypothetical protein
LKSKKLNNGYLGLGLGLIGPFFGLIIFGLLWSWYYGRTFQFFLSDIVLQFKAVQAPVLSLSLVFNLILFLIFIKFDHYKTARGILGATFIYVPIMFYLKFFR